MAGLQSDWEWERQMCRQRNARRESQEMGQEVRSCVRLLQLDSYPFRTKQMQSREPERKRASTAEVLRRREK
jgi:hypothetical protein